MEDKQMKEDYVPGSSIYDLFVRKEVKLITVLYYSLVSKTQNFYSEN